MSQIKTVYLEDDVLDMIQTEKKLNVDFNLSRKVNELLRNDLYIKSDLELRKKRLELTITQEEIKAQTITKKIEVAKTVLKETNEEQLQQEVIGRKQKELDDLTSGICKHAQTIDNNPQELLAYFRERIKANPLFSKEIGAIYDMKSWRKITGYVEL